jgi:hypothetical protein
LARGFREALTALASDPVTTSRIIVPRAARA